MVASMKEKREQGWNPSAAAASDFAADFKEYTSNKVMCQEYVLTHSLKQRYPDYHVTYIDGDSCDLRGFAAAGFADCELDNEDDSFVALTAFHMNPFRLDRTTNPGSFNLKPFFARYRYEWQGTEFLYYATCVTNGRGHMEDYHFLLTPRGGSQQQGQTQELTKNQMPSTTEALLKAVGIWSNELHDEVLVFDMAYWKKSPELWKSTESATWDDVILNPETKDGIIEDIEGFFASQELYKEFGVPWKRGVILHGLPGNGKTISIKALMSRLRKRSPEAGGPVPSLYVKSFEDQCSGPQYSIKKIFDRARRTAPCLLIFEDLDSLITDRTRSYFLNEVDGLESNDGILMVGSTNHLDRLDPAIRDRPSRFDRKYFYRLPAHAERAAYVRYWKAKVDRSPRVAFPDAACDFIADITDGFSFAYLKELFVAVLLTIARGGKGDEPLPSPSESEEAETPESAVVLSSDDDNDDDEDEDGGNGKDNKEEKKAKAKAEKKKTKKKAEELKKKLEAARLRREALAKVEVPDSLRDSVLVKVVRQQMYTLLREMDNNEIGTKEENKDAKSKVRIGAIFYSHGDEVRSCQAC